MSISLLDGGYTIITPAEGNMDDHIFMTGSKMSCLLVSQQYCKTSLVDCLSNAAMSLVSSVTQNLLESTKPNKTVKYHDLIMGLRTVLRKAVNNVT